MEVDIPTRPSTTGDPRLSKGPQHLQINTSILSPRQTPSNLPSTSRVPSVPVRSKSTSDIISENEGPSNEVESQIAAPVEGNDLMKALFQFTETRFKVLSEQEEKKRLESAALLHERDVERVKKTSAFPAAMHMFKWAKEKSDNEIEKLDTSLEEHQAVCQQLMAQISRNVNFGFSPASPISSSKALPPPPSSEYDKERIDKLTAEVEELKETSDKMVNSVKFYQGRINRLNTDADEFQSWRQNLETGLLQLPLQTTPEAISNLPQDVREAQAKADEAHRIATNANQENFSVTQKVDALKTAVSQIPRPDLIAIAEQRSSLENLKALSESHTSQMSELKIYVDNAIKGLPSGDQLRAQLTNEGRHVVPQTPNDRDLMKTWATRFEGLETMQVQLESKTNVTLEQLRRLLQQEGRWNHTSDLLDKSLRLLKSCEVGVRSLEKRYENINTGDLVKQMSRFIIETYSTVPQLREEIFAYKTQLRNEIQILQHRTNIVDTSSSISDESMRKVEDLIKLQLSPLVEEQFSQSASITKQLRDLHELQGRLESHSTAFQLLIDEDISILGNKGEKLSADIQLLTESWQSKLGDLTGQFEFLKASVEDVPGWIEKMKVLEPVDRIPQILDALGSVDDVKEIRNILQEKNNAVSSLEKLNDMIADLFGELGEIRKMIEQNPVLRQSRRLSPTPVTTGQLDGAEKIPTESHTIPNDEPVHSPAALHGESSVPPASAPAVSAAVTTARANSVPSAPISGNSTPGPNPGLKVRGHAEKSRSKSKKRRRLALDSDNESHSSTSSFRNGTPTSVKTTKLQKRSKICGPCTA
ncbi:uncharacterized protein N7483_009781 [Penicillium malachiteum]|uniref:uncharacterized protein n=1 Tax=Penicillium malachiteum TaxID=1324776 RepID=UPI002547D9C2|nr:uncharacterized protein N7483_009781 [Penicillium malachiteum]KAJ5721847.1 hypothetical protein N7483_009781 [Penicillium malachiteum]